VQQPFTLTAPYPAGQPYLANVPFFGQPYAANTPFFVEQPYGANMPFFVEQPYAANMPLFLEQASLMTAPLYVEQPSLANAPFLLQQRFRDGVPVPLVFGSNGISGANPIVTRFMLESQASLPGFAPSLSAAFAQPGVFNGSFLGQGQLPGLNPLLGMSIPLSGFTMSNPFNGSFGPQRWSGFRPMPPTMAFQPGAARLPFHAEFSTREIGLPFMPGFGMPQPNLSAPPLGQNLMSPSQMGPALPPPALVSAPQGTVPLAALPSGPAQAAQASVPIAALPAGPVEVPLVTSDVAAVRVENAGVQAMPEVPVTTAGVSSRTLAALPGVDVLPRTGSPTTGSSGFPIGALAGIFAIIAGVGMWGWSFAVGRRD
jgi:hypothetical protein